jgi:hypothetical protein
MNNAQAKLDYIAETKEFIRAAIADKGVLVEDETTFREYVDKIAEIPSGQPTAQWHPDSQWIDISGCNENEINLLVTEGVGIGFSITTDGSGTYSVDWGDGIFEHNIASGATVQHQHLTNGTPWGNSFTWKIRIYNATGQITNWIVKRHTYTVNIQYHPILWAVFGTLGITSYNNAFYNPAGADVQCNLLQSCVIPSFEYCTLAYNMFSNCYALQNVVLPETWGAVTDVEGMFEYCYSLTSIVLPESWGNVDIATEMFYSCRALSEVNLPSNWGSVTNLDSMFYNCYSLTHILLPNRWSNITDVSDMFFGCSSLRTIDLPTGWDIVSNCNGMFRSCHSLKNVILPSSWGNVTNIGHAFYYCQSLSHIQLPNSWGIVNTINVLFFGCTNLASIILPASSGNINNAESIFYNCYSLKSIQNLEYIGSLTAQCNLADSFDNCEFLTGILTFPSLISKIGMAGTSGFLLKITGVRLTNPGSLFAGSSPQIDVSYTSLDAAALEALFSDLPVLAGKTIRITGCPGAAASNKTIAIAKGWSVTS